MTQRRSNYGRATTFTVDVPNIYKTDSVSQGEVGGKGPDLPFPTSPFPKSPFPDSHLPISPPKFVLLPPCVIPPHYDTVTPENMHSDIAHEIALALFNVSFYVNMFLLCK